MKRLLVYILFVLILLCSSFAFSSSQQKSGVTAQTIINRARYFLRETTAKFWNDDPELLFHLNNGMVQIATQSFCLQSSVSITLQTGVSSYAISGVSYFDIESIVDNNDSGVTNKAFLRGNVQSIGNSPADNQQTKYPVYWIDWGGEIIIYPEPEGNVNGHALTVFLYETPSPVIITEKIPIPEIYETALTYFIVYHAAEKDRISNKSIRFETRYREEMERLKIFFNKRPKEPIAIIK